MTDESKPKVEVPSCPFCGEMPFRGRWEVTHVPIAICRTALCPLEGVEVALDDWNRRARSRPAVAVVGPSTTGTPVHPVTRTAPPSSDPAPAPRETAGAVAPDTGVPITFLREHGFVVPPEDVAGLLRETADALEEIAKGEGAYSMDQLTHAFNTIENMKSLADPALIARLRAAAKGGA